MDEQYVGKGSSAEVEGASNVALVLEIVFGFFGLLGIGHVYTNRIALGIGLLIGWWIYIIVAVFIATLTLGFGLCLLVPIYIAGPIISGIQARAYAKRADETGNWGVVAGVAGGGCLIVILANVLFFVVIGGIAALSSL